MSVSYSGVTKSYRGRLVLDDISDVVNEGELTALLGPSGSGKSTLLKIIAGLTPLDSGRVSLAGKDVTNEPARNRRIGFCFQDYAPFRHLSLRENVAYGLKVQHVARAKRREQVDELLHLVRLEDYADQYPHQLSGGQRQRMALARALAIKPDVLLLDEPFAALDAQVRGELRSWVRSLQKEVGITTILVTHDQAEAMEISDRLVILNEGRIEQVGRPSFVYDHPATDFVASFLGPIASLGGISYRPHELELVTPTSDVDTFGVRDVVRLGFEVRVVLGDEHDTTWVQLTHDQAKQLGPRVGQRFGVRVRPKASASKETPIVDREGATQLDAG
jgi:sulfate transport system ATP-binding protein